MQLPCTPQMNSVRADAWIRPELAHSLANHNDEEADAYLLLDQHAVRLAEAYAEGGLLQMQSEQFDGSFSHQAMNGCNNGELCTDPGSPRLAEQQNSRKGQSVSAGSKPGRANGRKCTTLAQREAHKRYREKKKQNIAAMEAEVQVKRNELQQLLAENESLKSRARVLETAERCSVEIHELMKLLDGLQSLGDKAEVTEGIQAGNECYSSRARSSGSNLASGSAEGSSQRALDGLSVNAAAAAAAAEPAVGIAAAPANPTCSSPPHSDSHSTFLRTLMHSTDSPQQQQEPSAAQIKQEQQQAQSTRLSLQDEAHWLQLAQQYLDMQDCQQQAQHTQPPCAHAPHMQPEHAKTGPTTPAPASGAVGGPCSAATGAAGTGTAGAGGEGRHTGQTSSVSNVSPSSTAESGSTVLADLGSVDTAEQGLVIYKAFLQKASEMLALAQQQQLQADLDAATATEQQLGEFTRNTIGRLQPFLVARGQGVVYEWNTRNLETHQAEEPRRSLWPAVLDALQLTSDVQRDALHCFELFGASLTRLLEERAQLARQYRQLQARTTSGPCNSVGIDVLHYAAARTFEAVAEPIFNSMVVLRALAANLERYQSLDGVFAHSLTNLLTGAQIAAACVASYPYLPRWHTMMSTLKQRMEDECQLQQQGGLLHDGLSPSKQPQRRSSRVRTATKVAQEAAYV